MTVSELLGIKNKKQVSNNNTEVTMKSGLSLTETSYELILHVDMGHAEYIMNLNANTGIISYHLPDKDWGRIYDECQFPTNDPSLRVVYSASDRFIRVEYISVDGNINLLYQYASRDGHGQVRGLLSEDTDKFSEYGINYTKISDTPVMTITNSEIEIVAPTVTLKINDMGTTYTNQYGLSVPTIDTKIGSVSIQCRRLTTEILCDEFTLSLTRIYDKLIMSTDVSDTSVEATVEDIAKFINTRVMHMPRERCSMTYLSSENIHSDIDILGVDDPDESIGSINESVDADKCKSALLKEISRMYITANGKDYDTKDVEVTKNRAGEYVITLKLV